MFITAKFKQTHFIDLFNRKNMKYKLYIFIFIFVKLFIISYIKIKNILIAHGEISGETT